MAKERLTQRDEFGNAEIIALSDSMSDLYGALLTYKERDALEDALNKLSDYEDKEENREATPTADVQEVRHGKNVTTLNPVDEFECSECGFVCEIQENIYDDEYTLDCQREYNPKFCPECGAKMDEEEL